MSAGFVLLGTVDASTPFVLMRVYLAMVGIGTGMTMQNWCWAVG